MGTTRPLASNHRNALGTRVVLKVTPAHDAVLAILDWWPVETVADAAPFAALLAMPEADAAWLLDELEAAGCVAGATGPQ
jgi:hypothetical protein